MPSARDVTVRVVNQAAAAECVRRWHYSGRVVQNSQVHFGAFLGTRLLGAMSFGPPLDRRKVLGLVADTPWDGMMELNRMAFCDELPRNSESRCLGVAARHLAVTYPRLQWLLSFADGVQCGDGTIYRAAGWLLTAVSDSGQILESPSGERFTKMSLSQAGSARRLAALRSIGALEHAASSSMAPFMAAGFKVVPGFMLRYLKPLRDGVEKRLTVPTVPYSAIAQMGAAMYRARRPSSIDDAPTAQVGDGGLDPTDGLQSNGGRE